MRLSEGLVLQGNTEVVVVICKYTTTVAVLVHHPNHHVTIAREGLAS
jgi:hypothetical protein